MERTSWCKKDDFLRASYFVLVILRFLFSCFVQNGYLYPDEFFQSSEIMARDILEINSTITWEWNEAFPVRSPVSAFLTSGIPFLTLRLLSKYVNLSPNLFLIFPRIYMTLISLISFDIPVYVISQRLNLKPFHCLLVLSTSYVTHVFATRPFSNTLESGILGILLMLFTPHHKKQPPGSMKDVLDIHYMPSYKCLIIGCLTSLGVFCRQTFPVFALVPYIQYVIVEMNRQQIHMLQIVRKTVLMALGFVITTVVFVLLDSWYFGHLKNGEIVFTSWNFVKYNSLQSHIHGHHPFFTHFLINIPLLFGPMALLFYYKLGLSLLNLFYGPSDADESHICLSDKKLYKMFLLLSILIPILILSVIPHQEPRFIIPVLLPMVLLFSSKVISLKYSSTILMSWCVWNTIGFIFFGILHQGGVVPSLLHLHKVIHEKVQSSSESYCHHVIYFHTYMPPVHLLAWPNRVSTNGHKLYIYDLAGSSQETFVQTLSKLKSDYCVEHRNMVRFVIEHNNYTLKTLKFLPEKLGK